MNQRIVAISSLLALTALVACTTSVSVLSSSTSNPAGGGAPGSGSTGAGGETIPSPASSPCDGDYAPDDPDPIKAARAMDICDDAIGPLGWGLVSAAWVLPDGAPPSTLPGPPNPQQANFGTNGHSLLREFGPSVTSRRGLMMVGLSSGAAFPPSVNPLYFDASPDGLDKEYPSALPPGLPKATSACGGATPGPAHDGEALELTLRSPPNAVGFSFDVDYYTFDWPSYVCSPSADVFASLLLGATPPAPGDGNITFDGLGDPLSASTSFLEVCDCVGGPPCLAGGKSFTCALGASQLFQSGYGVDMSVDQAGHGATGWLTTTAPIAPFTTFTMRWAIWDSGDGLRDSTVLVDNFQWITSGTAVLGTTRAAAP